ncbi:MAG: hypothetical protein JWP88_1566 [Flaviaesturariibacter sp.]|nr:hypothetical protein [Flaviaesturariibacter sp.]
MSSNTDISFLKERYALARNKYKPSPLKTLLIAEGPPCNLERFFYFEDVKRQDSLFLEIMGVLYPQLKERYLASGRSTELKEELLAQFQADGFWLQDLSEVPTEYRPGKLEDCVPGLLTRVGQYATKKTPIILIKASVYDLCYPVLTAAGYYVSPERLPFPGSGQQKVFREGFKRVVDF